jgi:methyl-accepting chemotaxis protein
VPQLDQMTQQNAALVEESAAAAESLKDQARRLSDVVSTFKLGNHDNTSTAYQPMAALSPAKASTAAPALRKPASPPTMAKAKATAVKPRLPAPSASSGKSATGTAVVVAPVRDAAPSPAPAAAPVKTVVATSAPGDDWETF